MIDQTLSLNLQVQSQHLKLNNYCNTKHKTNKVNHLCLHLQIKIINMHRKHSLLQQVVVDQRSKEVFLKIKYSSLKELLLKKEQRLVIH
jgi:phospholipid N-methyltransferase